ncbi:MAG: hypothetical protein ACNA7K_05950 [Acholeplasmataceae bacterium]
MFFYDIVHNKYFKLFMLTSAFLMSSWAIFLLVERIFAFPNQLDRAIATVFYFTTQSNLLVWVVLVQSFTKLTAKSWFKTLSFIAVIDIIITAVIFHLFLAPFLHSVELMQHVLHTFVPLIFVMFYALFLSSKMAYKKFYLSLIHPLIFLFLIYVFVEPFFGDRLNVIYPDYESARYVYPFLDPAYFSSGIYGLILFIIGVLTPFISLTAVLVIFLTGHVHDCISLNNKKKDQ